MHHLGHLLLFMPLFFLTTHCTSSGETASSDVPTDSLLTYQAYTASASSLTISRADYREKLHGFWLGQCIANWTGLITEMDKIGGEGVNGRGAGFYTREAWGGPDEPNLWGAMAQGDLPDTIGFFLVGEDGVWGADDDTDIEYIYQYITYTNETTRLSPEQIRDGWLTHIYSDENTPFRGPNDQPENFLWVSNQTAHDLMRDGLLPPATSDPANNHNYEMIDAQLTTEIFGFFAPGRPDVALELARLPIRTTARDDAAWISEFHVIMYSLAPIADPDLSRREQLEWMAGQARRRLPADSYAAKMYDFVKDIYESGAPWEAARDSLYQKYQVRMEDGYDIPGREPACYGCFAAGINFGAGLVSLFYGEGDFKETIKIGALAGWDSDNPTATWGGLLGFMLGEEGLEQIFGQELSDKFNIHRTRGGFPQGIDNFDRMARMGLFIVDRVVQEEMQGGVDLDKNVWHIPSLKGEIQPAD